MPSPPRTLPFGPYLVLHGLRWVFCTLASQPSEKQVVWLPLPGLPAPPSWEHTLLFSFFPSRNFVSFLLACYLLPGRREIWGVGCVPFLLPGGKFLSVSPIPEASCRVLNKPPGWGATLWAWRNEKGLIPAQGSSVLSTHFNGNGQVAHDNLVFCKLSSDQLVPCEINMVGQIGNYRK